MDVSKKMVADWIEDTVNQYLTGRVVSPKGWNCWLDTTLSEVVNGQNTFRIELRSERHQENPDRVFWVRLDVVDGVVPQGSSISEDDPDERPCRRCRWQSPCIVCNGKACGWCPDCSPLVPDQ